MKKKCGSNSEREGFATNVKGKGKWAKKKGQGNGEDVTRILKNITCQWQGGPYEETLKKEVC